MPDDEVEVSRDAITVRTERPDDFEAIDEIVSAAFLAEFGTTTEVALIRTMRERQELVPELTLVAEDGGRVVGHIVFSEVTLWEHLLPALEPSGSPESPESPEMCADMCTGSAPERIFRGGDEELAARVAGLTMRTAAERRGGGPPAEVPAMTFRRAPAGTPSHPTVTSIETSDGRMIVHEDDRSIGVPLMHGWSVDDGSSFASSATRLADGTFAVDLVFLATPHRLEIELDPVAGTFAARWPFVPLFGAGLDPHLASMRAPEE